MLFLAGTILIVGAIRSVTSYAQGYLFDSVSELVPFHVRNNLFTKFQALSFGYHDKQQIGDLMSRATSDVEEVKEFPTYGLANVVDTLLYVGGAVVLMLALNWQLGLVVTAFLLVAMLRSVRVVPRMVALWKEAQEQTGRMATSVQEGLAGMRVVKAFGAEDYELGKFRQAAEAVRRYRTLAGLAFVVRMAESRLILNLAVVTVLWLGAREVAAGRLTGGEVAAFMLYIGILTEETTWAGMLISRWAMAYSAGNRIFAVLDAESPVTEAPNATSLPRARGHIRFENVSFSYEADVPTLRNVDIEVEPGQAVAILGASGSGKSTIAYLVARFYDVTEGRVTLDGTDVKEVTFDSLRRNVGIVLQDSTAFAATIRDNISYGVPEATEERIVRAAEIAQLHEFVQGLPDGYNTWVGERGITLSGGQLQRVAIARTLLMDPPVLVLDDSTSSVDVGTEYQIQRALEEVIEGRTTIVIAHRLSTVRNADLVLVVEDGEIAERGTHKELLAKDGMYRHIYDLQLGPQDWTAAVEGLSS